MILLHKRIPAPVFGDALRESPQGTRKGRFIIPRMRDPYHIRTAIVADDERGGAAPYMVGVPLAGTLGRVLYLGQGLDRNRLEVIRYGTDL